MDEETPLIKFHTMEDPDPLITELTPEQIERETNPETIEQ